MKELRTTDRLISDMEFELAQGVVSTDDLGQAIQAVLQYQNRARSELLRTSPIDSREFAARSFQIDDMLINLLQETVGRIEQLQMELKGMRPGAPLTSVARQYGGVAPDYVISDRLGTDLYERSPAEIETAMRDAELQIGLDARPIKTPLVGMLLTRLRNAVHSLPLFYVRRLAAKQAAINHVYGDWILHLYRLLCRQQDEIEALNKQLAQLRNEGSQGGVDPASS
jgi:hypothetical protein